MQLAPRPRAVMKLALAFSAVLALSACAKNAADDASDPRLSAGYGRNGGPGSAQDFAATAGDRVFFETDSTDLTQTAQATLDKQAEWLNRYARYSFTIEGHADERGTREYNFGLGSQRAAAVKNYLISRGVAAGRIRTVSYGKERPVAVCDDISCWSQNRRAVTVLAGGAGS